MLGLEGLYFALFAAGYLSWSVVMRKFAKKFSPLLNFWAAATVAGLIWLGVAMPGARAPLMLPIGALSRAAIYRAEADQFGRGLLGVLGVLSFGVMLSALLFEFGPSWDWIWIIPVGVYWLKLLSFQVSPHKKWTEDVVTLTALSLAIAFSFELERSTFFRSAIQAVTIIVAAY